MHPVLVGQWNKEILEQAGTLFEGRHGPKPQETHESEDRLYGGIGRLKMELDWLKKGVLCRSEGMRNEQRGSAVALEGMRKFDPLQSVARFS